MNPLSFCLTGVSVWQGAGWICETAERHAAYHHARAVADARGKPLLNIGCPSTRPFRYPCGDVCVDIAPGRLRACRSRLPVLGDVRDLSRFRDKAFGCALCLHVLEHLPAVADANRALSELQRVSDVVVIVSPTKLLPIPWLHPDHYLWVETDPNGQMTFTQRTRNEPWYPAVQAAWTLGEALIQACTPPDRPGLPLPNPTEPRNRYGDQ